MAMLFTTLGLIVVATLVVLVLVGFGLIVRGILTEQP